MQKIIFFVVSLFFFNNSMIYGCCGKNSVQERERKNIECLKRFFTARLHVENEQICRKEIKSKWLEQLRAKIIDLKIKLRIIKQETIVRIRLEKDYNWEMLFFNKTRNNEKLKAQRHRAIIQHMSTTYHPDSQPVSPSHVPNVHFGLTPCSSRHPSPCPSQQVTPCTSKHSTPSKIPLSDITNRSNVVPVSVSDL